MAPSGLSLLSPLQWGPHVTGTSSFFFTVSHSSSPQPPHPSASDLLPERWSSPPPGGRPTPLRALRGWPRTCRYRCGGSRSLPWGGDGVAGVVEEVAVSEKLAGAAETTMALRPRSASSTSSATPPYLPALATSPLSSAPESSRGHGRDAPWDRFPLCFDSWSRAGEEVRGIEFLMRPVDPRCYSVALLTTPRDPFMGSLMESNPWGRK